MKKEVVYPLNWRLVKVEDASEILDSQRIPINAEHRSLMQGNIPYYGANGIQGYINKYIFDEDLILLAEDGGYFEEYFSRPIAYKVSGKSWVNNHAHILRIKNDFDYNYVFYSLVHKNILPFIKGGTRSKLNQLELRAIEFIAPLLPEQQRIAEILTTVDNAIEKTEALIEKYKNIKQGMMQDLLTKGIDEYGNIRSEGTHEFKDSPIGRIPILWDDCLISDYISFQKSGLSRKISHEDIGIPVLTSSNIDNNSKLDVKELKYWYESDPQGANIADYVLEKGDILLCFINSIEQMGKLCIFDDIGRPCIYTTNLFRIKASTNTTPKFLYYLLLSHYVQNEIRVITKPAINQASFTKQDFAKTKVPLISVEEQAKIVEALDSANARIETEITHLNKLTLLKQGLMQDLLTGTVRVPLEEATG